MVLHSHIQNKQNQWFCTHTFNDIHKNLDIKLLNIRVNIFQFHTQGLQLTSHDNIHNEILS